jgi:hypothetical protein
MLNGFKRLLIQNQGPAGRVQSKQDGVIKLQQQEGQKATETKHAGQQPVPVPREDRDEKHHECRNARESANKAAEEEHKAPQPQHRIEHERSNNSHPSLPSPC